MTREVTALPPDTVHVWQGPLPADPATVETALAVLSESERRRAASYRSQAAAAQFIVGRSWLRDLLGGYTGMAPEVLAIRSPRHEKPSLVGAPGDIRFSVTHAAGHIACAVAAGFEVGIDIEAPRPGAADALVGTILSAEEAAHLAEIPARLRDEAVMRHWTRKEAVLKGLGTGLRLPPARLELDLDPLLLLEGAVASGGGTTWSLWDLEVAGAFGAVAAASTRAIVETPVAPTS